MRNLSVLSTRAGETYARGMQVIIRTQRGIESGEVLCEATEHVVANMVDPKGGQILHEQSEEDKREIGAWPSRKNANTRCAATASRNCSST